MFWGVVDVVGFYFLDLARSYVPPPELEVFLYLGEPPIYIGLVNLSTPLDKSDSGLWFRFGSIVVDDPKEMTRTHYFYTSTSDHFNLPKFAF